MKKLYATKRVVLLKKRGYALPKNNCHCYIERTNCKD